MTTDREKFKKEMEASQYFMNKNAKSMFDIIDMCKYYQIEENAVRQTDRSEAGNFVNLLNQEMEELKNSMRDKEKQIKEIETIIKSNLAEGSFANAFAKKVAIQIVEHYQSKLSEDSVVLSKEECEKLQNENKRLFYRNSNLILENKNLKENLEIEILKSKETAEKITNRIKQSLNSVKTIVGDSHKLQPEIGYSVQEVDNILDNIESNLISNKEVEE